MQCGSKVTQLLKYIRGHIGFTLDSQWKQAGSSQTLCTLSPEKLLTWQTTHHLPAGIYDAWWVERWDSCGYLLVSLLVISTNQPCQNRLSQATTTSTSSGHHWQCMAREHPFEGNYGTSTNTQSERLWKRTVGNAKRRTRGICLSPRVLANWF